MQLVAGTVGQHILTRQRDLGRTPRWDSSGCVGMLTHCGCQKELARALPVKFVQSGVSHRPVEVLTGLCFPAELVVVSYPALAPHKLW